MRIARVVLFCSLPMVASSAAAGDMQMFNPSSAAFDWVGMYVGVNAGYGFGRYKEEWHEIADPSVRRLSDSVKLGGGFIGGQIGANFQAGNIVWGVEADIQKSAIKGGKTIAFLVDQPADINLEIDWFATVRARVGYAIGPSLLYLTGGLIHGKGIAEARVDDEFFKAADTKTGWTVGAGYESALGSDWTWRIEYLYADFGKEQRDASAFNMTRRTSLNSHLVRFGANYRFGD